MTGGQRPRIYARIRPEQETEDNLFDFFDDQQLCLESKDAQQLTYNFDRVFGPDSKQTDVLDAVTKGPGGILNALKSGYDATVFAYGQTGSGKTYSMEGGGDWATNERERGLVPRLLQLIFNDMGSDSDISDLQVAISFTELYNESIRDLLQSKADLPVHQEASGGFAPKGAMKAVCSTMEEAIRVYQKGSFARSTESTNMNATSSRSHALLIVDLNWMVTGRGRRHARLNLLDLAGSEGLVKTGNVVGSLRAKEGIMINLSLLCLKRVVDCLAKANRPSHIPFRESKLTRLLQSSLGGNNVLHILLALRNQRSNREESVDALRFASACARMRLAPKQNTMSTTVSDMPGIIKDQLSKIDNLERENAELRARMEEKENLYKGLENLPVHSSALREELMDTESQIRAAQERVNSLVTLQEFMRAAFAAAREGDATAMDKLRQELANARATSPSAGKRRGNTPTSGVRPGSASSVVSTGENLAREIAEAEEELEQELRGLSADLSVLNSNKADLELQLRNAGELSAVGPEGVTGAEALTTGPSVQPSAFVSAITSPRTGAAAPGTDEVHVTEQLRRARESETSAQAELEDLRRRLRDVERERDDLLAETSSLQDKLQRESAERSEEATTYHESVTTTRLELRELQAREAEHAEQLANLKGDHAAMAAREAEALADLERAKADAALRSDAAVAAEAKLQDLKRRAVALREQVRSLGAQPVELLATPRTDVRRAPSVPPLNVGDVDDQGYSDDLEAPSDDFHDTGVSAKSPRRELMDGDGAAARMDPREGDQDYHSAKDGAGDGPHGSVASRARHGPQDAEFAALERALDDARHAAESAIDRADKAEAAHAQTQSLLSEAEQRVAEMRATLATHQAESAASLRKLEEGAARDAALVASLRTDVQRERAELTKLSAARQALVVERTEREEALRKQAEDARARERTAVEREVATAAERDEAMRKVERLETAEAAAGPKEALHRSPAVAAAAAAAANPLPSLDEMLELVEAETASERAEEEDAALRAEVSRAVAELPSVGACNGLRALVEVSNQSRAATLRLFREVGGPAKLATMLQSSEASYVIPYVLDEEGVRDFLHALHGLPEGRASGWARLQSLLLEANDLRSKVYAATAVAGLARCSTEARGELCAHGFGQALLQTLQWCAVQPVPPQEVQRHACAALAELLEGQEDLKLTLVELGVLQLLLALLSTVPDVIRAAVTCIGRLAGGSEACSDRLVAQGALPTLCSLLWDRALLGNDAMIAELAALALANVAASSQAAMDALRMRRDFYALRLELLGALGLAAGSRLVRPALGGAPRGSCSSHTSSRGTRPGRHPASLRRRRRKMGP